MEIRSLSFTYDESSFMFAPWLDISALKSWMDIRDLKFISVAITTNSIPSLCKRKLILF
jgi:hypothetical protein